MICNESNSKKDTARFLGKVYRFWRTTKDMVFGTHNDYEKIDADNIWWDGNKSDKNGRRL